MPASNPPTARIRGFTPNRNKNTNAMTNTASAAPRDESEQYGQGQEGTAAKHHCLKPGRAHRKECAHGQRQRQQKASCENVWVYGLLPHDQRTSCRARPTYMVIKLIRGIKASQASSHNRSGNNSLELYLANPQRSGRKIENQASARTGQSGHRGAWVNCPQIGQRIPHDQERPPKSRSWWLLQPASRQRRGNENGCRSRAHDKIKGGSRSSIPLGERGTVKGNQQSKCSKGDLYRPEKDQRNRGQGGHKQPLALGHHDAHEEGKKDGQGDREPAALPGACKNVLGGCWRCHL